MEEKWLEQIVIKKWVEQKGREKWLWVRPKVREQKVIRANSDCEMRKQEVIVVKTKKWKWLEQKVKGAKSDYEYDRKWGSKGWLEQIS